MARWNKTIDFKSFWHDEDLSLSQKADKIADQLYAFYKANPEYYNVASIDAIADDFKAYAQRDDDDPDAIDDILDDMYDWADGNSVWIATI